ncbi:helix-turn-helix domain-containing protein [Virgibacillus necropolis]|nr:helix-turn-helix transcriptional regulator [Virgibacillus necropolis]
MDVKLFVTIRKLSGSNQYQYAGKLGISRSLVAKIETGERAITTDISAKVREEFGADYIEQVAKLVK